MKPLELRQRRKNMGITQIELANLLGVSEPTIVSYEKGYTKIPASKTQRLKEIFNPKKEAVPVPLSIGELIDIKFESMQSQINDLKRQMEELKKPGNQTGLTN